MLLDIPKIPDIPDIPDGWKYVVSSLVGGGIAILVTFLNNRYQLRKDSQQWEREKLWDGYQKCISSLALMESLWIDIRISEEGEHVDIRISEQKKIAEQMLSNYSEIYPYLYWIIYNYLDPKLELEEIKTLKEEINNKVGIDHSPTFMDIRRFASMPCISAVHNMKQELINLMINDTRLLKKNK